MKEKDKLLLKLEVIIGILASIVLFSFIVPASTLEIGTGIGTLLIITGLILFIWAMCYGLKIEQVAGYYECGKCHHKHIPTYKSVFLAMHIGRTRYLTCPKCKKKSWNKKRLSK